MRFNAHHAVAALFACVSCATGAPMPVATVSPQTTAQSFWVADLVRTRPGMQDEYLRGIAANWAGARRIAHERGIVRSYQAFAVKADSALPWDVILFTEYADSASFAGREESFRQIFELPAYISGRYNSARSPTELRTFFATELRVAPVAVGSR